MSKSLHVYLNRKRAGLLIQNEHGLLEFEYSHDYLEYPKAIPLSNSLPLRPEIFSARECRGFFSGILPEEINRELVAKNLGISAGNDFSMLKEIGGECAGAISFLSEEQEARPMEDLYRNLSESELATILKQLPHRPLLAGEESIRLSLAGAQSKLVVRVEGEKIAVPLNDSPSTHILKPDSTSFDGLVFNEAFCMKLADQCGLPTAKVEIRNAENAPYLLIERYDRMKFTGMQASTHGHFNDRLHQEDFCQALGILSKQKYEKEGGPSLKACFELVTKRSHIPILDRQRLLDAVIFNFLIGNNDAHGKNFSFTYHHNGEIVITRFAPLYDLICTAYYPALDKNMAMKLGSKSLLAGIKPEHFEEFASEASLSKSLVKKRVRELALKIQATIPKVHIDHHISKEVGIWINDHCTKVLALNW